MKKEYISKIFLILLLVAVIFACYEVYKPFLGEFLIATILVTIFYTPYEKLLKLLKGRKIIASVVMCFLIIMLVIIPLTSFISYTTQRSIVAYDSAQEYFNSGGVEDIKAKIDNNQFISNLNFFGLRGDRIKGLLADKIDTGKTWILSGGGNLILWSSAASLITGTANFITSVLIVIFCMLFFFMDGRKMVDKIMYWTPLSNKYDKEIFHKFKDVSFTTMASTFVSAITQGIIGAIGFLIAGFPAFFPGIAIAFAALIPFVGTALVWVPISVYLLIIGKIWQGIFLIIWGIIIIGNSDNLVRSYLIKKKAGVPPLFVFFSILGGLSLFGFWGIVFGPLIISLAVTIFKIYEMEYRDVLEE